MKGFAKYNKEGKEICLDCGELLRTVDNNSGFPTHPYRIGCKNGHSSISPHSLEGHKRFKEWLSTPPSRYTLRRRLATILRKFNSSRIHRLSWKIDQMPDFK